MDATDEKPRDRKEITVPRDFEQGIPTPEDNPPATGNLQINDQDNAASGRSLVEDTPAARALHDRPPQGPGQLDVGTGGDAGRPGKEGTSATSIFPRGRM